MNVKVERSEEATPYANVVTYDFGDRFTLNYIVRFEDPTRCSLEIIDNADEAAYGESFCLLNDIPRHQAESLCRSLLAELIGE